MLIDLQVWMDFMKKIVWFEKLSYCIRLEFFEIGLVCYNIGFLDLHGFWFSLPRLV